MTTDTDTPPAHRARSSLAPPVVAAIAAGLLGAVLAGHGPGISADAGLFFGALLGFGAALVWQQRGELAALEARVEALAEMAAGHGAAPAAASPPAATEVPGPGEAPGPGHVEAPVPGPEPVPHPPPSQTPPVLGALTTAAVRFFTTGNLVVRLGVVVLFFGVAFLLRYAYENALLPIELRLAGSALGGMVLTAAGWRLRGRTDAYGLILQGAGVGILYLVVFAAARLYDLLPMGAAFAALVVLVAASSLLAVLQRSQALALFATSGGFLAPVLMSTGSGSHVTLFSYYALLNAGILAMAWFRAWRWLNWAGFVFTFVIGAAWGRQYYTSELFASTEPFLILFFLYYVGVAVLFARRQGPDLKGLVDGTLVFGTPMAAFALQWGLVEDVPFGMAFSALGAATVYVLLALWLKRQGAFSHLLGQSFLALAVVFATLAVPFAFDDQRWTGAIWALEGAGLLWVGQQQRQLLPRLAGLALQVAAGVAFGKEWQPSDDAVLLVNGNFLGAAVLAAAGVFSAQRLSAAHPVSHPLEHALRWPFLYWGVAWWCFGGLVEIGRFRAPWSVAPDNVNEHLAVLFAALSTTVLVALARRLRWREALAPGLLLLPALAVALPTLDLGWRRATPFGDLGWLAWPGALTALYWHLASRDVLLPDSPERRLSRIWHTGAWWLMAAIAGWTAAALLVRLDAGRGWLLAAWAAAPLAAVAALLALATRSRVRWPAAAHPESYFGRGLDATLMLLLGWLLISGLSPANPRPLPYLVLLNPLELMQLGVLLAAGVQARRGPWGPRGRAVLALTAFAWLNLTAARAVHFYAGAPYPFTAIISRDEFLATASILWTTAALLLMGLGTRRGSRPSWVAGAVLLGLVMVKLFSVDLPRLAVLPRIVSFISVGVLMLAIGYFAPLPPSRAAQTAPERPPQRPAPA